MPRRPRIDTASSIRPSSAQPPGPGQRGIPALEALLSGIRRTHGAAPQTHRAIRVRDLQKMVRALEGSTSPTGRERTELAIARDRALLLLGFAGGLRRSELAALALADVERQERGLVVRIRRAKTDQEGRGSAVWVERVDSAYCPVAGLEVYIQVRGLQAGALVVRDDHRARAAAEPLGLSPHSVYEIVRRAAEAARLGPGEVGAHSLRSGHATTAVERGVPAAMERYLEEGRGLENAYTSRLGL